MLLYICILLGTHGLEFRPLDILIWTVKASFANTTDSDSFRKHCLLFFFRCKNVFLQNWAPCSTAMFLCRFSYSLPVTHEAQKKLCLWRIKFFTTLSSLVHGITDEIWQQPKKGSTYGRLFMAFKCWSLTIRVRRQSIPEKKQKKKEKKSVCVCVCVGGGGGGGGGSRIMQISCMELTDFIIINIRPIW